MRLPGAAHTTRPWRIHQLTGDFRVEDVWVVPVALGAGELPRLVELIASQDVPHRAPAPVRALIAARWKLGAVLRLDEADSGAGSWTSSLRERLPRDLRTGPAGPRLGALPLTPLYLTPTEWAAEAVNRTMHAVLHLGLVPHDSDRFTAQLAVLVKPNGALGAAYMAAIRPFRWLIVYPWLLAEIGRAWRRERSVLSRN